MQAASSTPPLTWIEVMLVTLAPTVVGVAAIWRVRSGWGGRASRLVPGKPWSEFLARSVHAVMPFTVGMILMALGGALGARLSYDTGLGWIRVSALVVVAVGLAVMAWGLKEFRSPSHWRRPPQWLREYEQRSKRPRRGR